MFWPDLWFLGLLWEAFLDLGSDNNRARGLIVLSCLSPSRSSCSKSHSTRYGSASYCSSPTSRTVVASTRWAASHGLSASEMGFSRASGSGTAGSAANTLPCGVLAMF